MNKTQKKAVRSYKFIRNRVAKIPKTISQLQASARHLAAYGWFDSSKILTYSCREEGDQVRMIIGEAAELWGRGTVKYAISVFESRDAWFAAHAHVNVDECHEVWLDWREWDGY